MPQRRIIKVKGIRREPIDTDKLAYVYWCMARRAVEEKRKRKAEDKKKERVRTGRPRKESQHAGR